MQSSRICPVQEAEFAVRVAKLCSPKKRQISKKYCHQMSNLRPKCTNSILARALPQTPMGELTVLPDSLAGFKGPALKGTERKGRKLCSSRNSFEHAPLLTVSTDVFELQVVENVYNRVGQLFYGFQAPVLSVVRRTGRPRTQHNSKLCQACALNICREAYSVSAVDARA